MLVNITLIVVFLGLLYFLAHAFTAIFSRTKIPDVFLLMLIGLCLGPIFNVIDPLIFGEIGQVFVTVTLVVILFQSGLGISFETFLNAWSRGLTLTIVNFFATTLVVGFAVILLLHLSPLNSFMLGAMVGGISSAVVIPILQPLKIRDESKTILLLESVLTDVLCIVIALALLNAQIGNTSDLGITIGTILSSFVVAIFLGILGALFWSIFLNRIRTLQNSILATPAFVCIIFGTTSLLGYSGYIAALAFGITIGNMELLKRPLTKIKLLHRSLKAMALNETEKRFFSEIVFLLKIFFFVYIGLSIRLTSDWIIYAGLILTALCFIIRIPVIRFSISRRTPKADASLMAVMVPKGLAAAALASLPLQQGLADGRIIQDVTFSIVLFSITLTSILVWLVHETPLSKLYYLMFPGFGPAALQQEKQE